MPLMRRMPKRGFNNERFTTHYRVVNLAALDQFEDGSVVDPEAIIQAGLANGPGKGVIKILGQGELTKKLTVKAHAFSETARTQIEAKGGTCEIVTSSPDKKG